MEQTNFQQGNPQKKKGGCLKYGLIGFSIFMLIGIVANLGGGSDKTSQNGNEDSTAVDVMDTVVIDPNSVSEETSDMKTWNYSTATDEMNDSKSRFASITSDNTVDFDFPYQGGSSLTLTVRYAKKYGTDVYVKISSGQFVGNEYEGTNNIRVRFDNGSPMKFTTNEPSDGSSDLLFLNNAKKFIKLAKKAKTIKIEAPFYQEGNRVFTFTVDEPLKWYFFF